MFGIGTTEILILMGIAILIFGARRLPELGSGMGKAIKNF
ncbi:MAG: twin-arginine translocase TatA/TatE family subunit, partial [Myxococcota bacterium]